ncbi:MAG: hypothetical protein U5L04_02425 [Trueperaceae bacterium]|nr:hypothetical protein [Trueperaceae bacterium]
MTSEDTPPSSGDDVTDETLMEEAITLTLSLLACIRNEDRNPMKHWTWAQKALKTGASRGTSFERLVSEMYDQLPIRDAIWKDQVSKIYSIGESLKSQGTYRRFRYLCKERAPAIIMMARVRKDRDPDRTENFLPGPEHYDTEEDT